MFDWFGGVPEGWEPIPDEVWAELPPPDVDGDAVDRVVDRAAAAGPGPASLAWLSAVPAEVLG